MLKAASSHFGDTLDVGGYGVLEEDPTKDEGSTVTSQQKHAATALEFDGSFPHASGTRGTKYLYLLVDEVLATESIQDRFMLTALEGCLM